MTDEVSPCGTFCTICGFPVTPFPDARPGYTPPLKQGEPTAFDRLTVHPSLLEGR